MELRTLPEQKRDRVTKLDGGAFKAHGIESRIDQIISAAKVRLKELSDETEARLKHLEERFK
jgi:hypothetical protein